MTPQQAIEVLKTEIQCVRNINCDRSECKSCHLVMQEQDILEAYEMAIQALEGEKLWKGADWLLAKPTVAKGGFTVLDTETGEQFENDEFVIEQNGRLNRIYCGFWNYWEDGTKRHEIEAEEVEHGRYAIRFKS